MTAITPELLLHAYRQGIFPMAQSADDPDLFWVNPELRGILPLNSFHIPKRLAREIRQSLFTVTVDRDFGSVIRACAEPDVGRKTTWISRRLVDLYEKLHDMGYAHSIECWRDRDLAGGLYGVAIGAAFCGESMFHRQTDASKIALAYLVARLKSGGFQLLDTQFITPHLQQFGAIEIPRDDYFLQLQGALARRADFHLLPVDTGPEEILQLITHTS